MVDGGLLRRPTALNLADGGDAAIEYPQSVKRSFEAGDELFNALMIQSKAASKAALS